jgi:hypothetical protein
MVDSAPFSITLDAEDYLKSRMAEMPPGMHPMLMMATNQNDGQNPPRWSYSGESFIIGYFDPNERPEMDCTELKLAGHKIAIETSALKHLSNRVLNLRRVDAGIGLLKNTHYVLVAGDTAASSLAFAAEGSSEKIKSYLSITFFTILGGFTGMGLTWIVFAASSGAFNNPNSKIWQIINYLFAAGWVLGAMIGFLFFKSIFKTQGRSQFHREQLQRKYVGRAGLGAEVDMYVWLGIPVSLTILVLLVLSRFMSLDAYNGFGVVIAIMIVFGLSFYFSDKIRHRRLFWLGLLGWMAALGMGYCFFKIHGP